MKNFRKVLALVLVIATLFSFAAMANAADDPFAYWKDEDIAEVDKEYYEDEADIDAAYLEAVRVLSFVEILNGYEDKTFQPDNNIRRNEMAKMIAVLANAGYDVDELYATAADFEDVPADDWAASYVAYCAKTGIVAGRSATTFDPNASVTGLETAKMLLVVLGYDAEQQGYVGADWKVNVLRDAKVMGLLEGFKADYNVDAAISREEAANMMLNALKAPCVVGFLSDNVITVTNTLVYGEKSPKPETNYAKIGNYATLRDAAEAGQWCLYGNVVISDDILSMVLFDVQSDLGLDCFGRPATVWTSAKDRKMTAIVAAPHDALWESHNAGIDDVKDFLYDYTKGEYNYVAAVNGELFNYGEEVDDLVNDLEDGVISDYTDNYYLGKGVQIEIYEVDGYVFVVIIDTYIATITKVNMAKGTVTFGGPNGDVETVENEWGFTAADVDETIVLLWVCDENRESDNGDYDWDIHDVEVVEPVVGTVTRVNADAKGNYEFIASGETYEYAASYGEFMGGPVFVENALYPGADLDEDAFKDQGLKDWNIYTDKFGYVMFVTPVTDVDAEFVVVDGDSWINDDPYMTADGIAYKSSTADFVKFEEDTIETVETTSDFNEAVKEAQLALPEMIDVDEDGNPDNDVLVWALTEDEDEMSLVAAEWSDSEIALSRGGVEIDTDDADIKNIKVNNNTQFIVRVPDYFGEDQDDFTYLYFNGIDEIDANYVAKEFQYFIDDCSNPDSKNYVDGMDFAGLEGSGRFYAYIYVDAEYAKEVHRSFILRHIGSSVLMLDNGKVMGGNKFEAIVNGEEAIVVYRDSLKTVKDLMGADEVPTMVRSELVLVGWTLDDIAVWAEPGVDSATLNTNGEKPEFRIDGDVLTWEANGSTEDAPLFMALKCDPEMKIWVAEPNKKGEWEAKLLDADELINYSNDFGYDFVADHGWAIAVDYAGGDGDSLYDYLMLVVRPDEDQE